MSSVGARAQTETHLAVEIGTPKQKVQLAIDTLYTGTLVLERCAELNEERLEQCTQSGTYNVNASETATRIEIDNTHGYSSTIAESYDDLTIGGLETLKNVSFHVQTDPAFLYYGILGLDYGLGFNTYTPTTLDSLVDQNIIASKSFSLALGGPDDDVGSLIFGGIDTKKFTGTLHKLPSKKPVGSNIREDEYHYWMRPEGVTLDDATGNVTRVPGFNFHSSPLGTGGYIPSDIAAIIARAYGVYEPSDEDADPKYITYPIDCELRDRVNGSVALEFPGGLNVSIPYREFISGYSIYGTPVTDCYIGSGPRTTPSDSWAIGNSFLRRVYAVFDQDEKAVWLAKYQNCGSEVVKFEREEGIRGQCGSGGGGSSTSNDENGGSGTSDDGSDGSESSSGGTQDGADDGSAGARAGVAMGAVVFAAVMSLAGL
ncbi:aspartic peptidase domain-containing protein [Plectosphaerella plurivora]|uniref:Aspartic peptidase domain-containing protein n=1 Tax=Plectosphaerella plurivora TaxID=936078 RepID=A0A9P8V047_9PEZI|nr:aspartic peptidase domain-containing protein [Plectosphaerella plurivora]